MKHLPAQSFAAEPHCTSELWSALRKQSESFAGRPAFSANEEFVTFEQLFARAEQLAAAFSAQGIGPGAVVGIALPNCVEFVTAVLATFKCSATVALISSKYRVSELQAIHAALVPHCYVATPGEDQALRGELASMAPLRAVTLEAAAIELLFLAGHQPTAPGPEPEDGLPPTRRAIIKLTSGSTGVPKGIALTPANVLAEARNIVDTLELTPADCILAPVPLAHSYGFDVGLLSMLWSGASLVARNTFVPRRLLAEMAGKETTVFLGVPSIYRTLADIPVTAKPDLAQVRYLLSCTAPLHPELLRAFHAKFGVPICQHYGSSETGAATTHVPALVMKYPESVGRAMSGVHVAIIDEAGRGLAAGEEGEVVIAGAAVAPGYVMGAPPGVSPFQGNSYRSGDLGYLDDSGLLHLTGRKSQIINVGGLKVSPVEVARVLESFPPIAEAVVLGLQGAGGSDLVCAVVTLRQPATREEIFEYCRQHLAEYKVPRRIEIRDALPRGATGKVKLKAEDLGL
jgi:long-chain acyl-CoA synthetase